MAQNFALKSHNLAPNNFIILRRIINTYILLNDADNKYKNELSTYKKELISLAPTDPQTYLTSAKIEISLSNKNGALEYLNQALNLKPDYIEAQELLKQLQPTIDN